MGVYKEALLQRQCYLRAMLAILTAGLLLTAGESVASEVSELVAEVRVLEAHRVHRGAPEAPRIPGAAYARALAGETVSGIVGVEGVPSAKGWGVKVLNLPVEAVWAAVNDEMSQPGRLPVSYSAIVGGSPHRAERLVFQYMPLPWPFSDRWWITRIHFSEQLYEQSRGRMWEMYWEDEMDFFPRGHREAQALADDGYPVSWTRGAWLLIPLSDGRTLVEYYVWSDPGGRLPAGPASRFAAGAVEETLNEITVLSSDRQGQVEGQGFVRPDGDPI